MRALLLLCLAGCAGISVERLRHAPTVEDIERLLRRRWPREFVREFCRWESRHHPGWQRLVAMGDLHLSGVLYPAEGPLNAVRWRAHRFEDQLSYELYVDRADRDTDGWVLEIGSADTLLRPLTWGEVVLSRVSTCVMFCGWENAAYDIVMDDDRIATYAPERLTWMSPAHGTLEAELDANRDVVRLLLNGKEDVELNRAYRARQRS